MYMLKDIFPVRIFKTNIQLDSEVRANIRNFLLEIFSNMPDSNHALEKGGKSTHSEYNQLHELPLFEPLAQHIKAQAVHYWGNSRFDPGYSPKIVSMWANLHEQDAETLEHSHNTHVISGCYYLDFEPGAGRLVFVNPQEYQRHYYPYSPEGKTEDIYYYADVEEQDVILFPSHVKHYTEKNKSGSNRISINFNIDKEEVRWYKKLLY